MGRGFFSYKEGREEDDAAAKADKAAKGQRKRSGDRDPIPVPKDVEMPKSGSRFQRFFAALRSGKQENTPMSPHDAHVSCTHCHLGNIAFRVGRSVEFDPKTERFKDQDVNKYLAREYRKGFEVPKLATVVVATV